MKILLALPLLTLIGVAFAKDQVSTHTCTSDHCIQCLNGFCIETRHKREASEGDQSSSSSCSSKNGLTTCTICKNGMCHTTSTGKREGNPMTFTPHSDTCETIEESKCRCENVQEKCTRCSEADPNFCVYFNKGVELSGQGKREVDHNSVTSKNCDNNGCHICESGNCRYEARGKREAGVHSKHCVEGHCIMCFDGRCYEGTKHKREQKDSTKTTCTYGICTKFENGKWYYYREDEIEE